MRRCLAALFLLAAACAPQNITQCSKAGWVVVGTGPAGALLVVDTVAKDFPALPICGVVSWQPGPWDCLGDGKPDCHGQREATTGPPTLDVTTAPLVEDTALVHELGHLVGYADGAAMDAWVATETAKVKKALGR
jgi:hypothetical protein